MDPFLTTDEEIALEQSLRGAAPSARRAVSTAEEYENAVLPLSQRFSQLWLTREDTPAGGWAASSNPLNYKSNANIPRDPIHRLINKELRRLREASYECFKLNLLAWPASHAPADLSHGSSAIKFFQFVEGQGQVLWGGEQPHTVPVMLVQGFDGHDDGESESEDEAGNADRDGDDGELYLKVRFNGRWRSFENFLHFLCDRRLSLAGPVPLDDELQMQFRWWRSNGKTFDLLGLPAEIRERIYHFAVQPALPLPLVVVNGGPLTANDKKELEKARRKEAWTVRPHRYARWPHRGRVPLATAPSVRLLRTNRQVAREAAHVLYRTARFDFDSPRQLEEFFCAVGGNFELLRRIRLRFGIKDLLRFFGAKLADSEGRAWEPSFAAGHLMYLAGRLLELEIVFPKPDAEVLSTEWLWDEERGLGCWTTVVDWVLASARPFVRNLPVVVSGSVDDEQKEAFLLGLKEEAGSNVCEDEEMLRDEEVGGVPLDLDSGYDSGNDGLEYFSLPVAKRGAESKKTVFLAESL